MRVAAVQSNIAWEDPEENFRRLEPWVEAAAGAGAHLVVLPEMFACGFSMSTERIAEPADGPSARFLEAQAERHRVWICGSLPERDGEGLPANTLRLAGPRGEAARYRKIHPFSYAGEDRHYRAGTEFTTVEIEELRVSFFICYDLRFADEFWALAEGTDLYVVVANWPTPRREHWRTLLRARAIENQAYVVGVNRVGEGNGLAYAGDSAVIDPLGVTLAEGSGGETLLLADVSRAHVARVREELPFLSDRRTRR